MFSRNQKLPVVAWIQSVFYTTTGLWPLIDIDSFMWVTGPKVDVWLVRTVGALLLLTGIALGRAARARRISGDLIFLAAGQALVLAVVDVTYVSVGRISPIYLLDAVAELLLVALWFWSNRQGAEENGMKTNV